MKLTFLGATDTVTGSRFLVEAGGLRVLVDCGLFQGVKAVRERNWAPFGVPPATLDAVVLTHAHIDHSGYLPALIRDGFAGPVFCSSGTAALCGLLLPDSGWLQEEEARYRNRSKTTRHQPALPLYTRDDAEAALSRLTPLAFREPASIDGVSVTLRPAGHILGAASVLLDDGHRRLAFSGDVGRPDDTVMRAPEPLPAADAVVVESTYGLRRHEAQDPKEALGQVLSRTLERGGVAIVPSFAVGRAQTLLHLISQLKAERAIPDVPVFLNSPMAIDATGIFVDHAGEHRLDRAACEAMCHGVNFTRSVEESKAINLRNGPMIVISASGMLSGGRVVHHVKAFGDDPRNAILLTGYQAAGTRGRALAEGADQVKIHGAYRDIRAEVVQLHMLSAHADGAELIDWLRKAEGQPQCAYVVHGEPAAQDAMRARIRDELGWRAQVPELGQTVDV